MSYTKEGVDHWQTWDETLRRVNEAGQCLGDCDDYAFLAQAILRKQGIHSQVVVIPGHALCAWVQKSPDGQYHAFSIDTAGYSASGIYDYRKVAHTKGVKGHPTPQAALNVLFEKYEGEKIEGVDEPIKYQITDGEVSVLGIGGEKGKIVEEISVDALVIDG